MDRYSVKAFVWVAIAVLALAPARADDLQTLLDATVKAARETHHLPAVAALLQVDGKVAAQSAVGVRALGHPEAVSVNDEWHIGSDTKAFTATMIARLVERGVMKFEDTLAVCFPEAAPKMNAAYRNVTVAQLLSHMAGLPPMTDDKDLPVYLGVIKGITDVKAQRAALAKFYLSQPPALTPGTEFTYSNLGFILAGAAAERRTGKSWEDLVKAEVFTPLGIAHAGFGVPGTSAVIDQPRGHDMKDGKLVAIDPKAEASDNPPSLGPAGTIHISLHDWMLFAQDQLDGALGHGKLLKPETYRRLHTPISSNGVYALGWGSKLGPNGVPLVLTHSGSNGYWLADVRVWPKHNIVLLVVTNAGNDEAEKAVKEVRGVVTNRLHPMD
jgi:CubicO group peptidase (beta-lactamase class C family)